jgi:DivIVA domain-containing protein
MNDDQTNNPSHRTPTEIRDTTFPRKMLGLDADQVYEYLDALADQVQACERERTELRAETERLTAELQRVRADLDEYEQVGERVNEQIVQMFSQAQLVAEEMVEDVSRDARERLGQARAHERRIVEEAMSTAGDQVRSYAQSAQLQMKSIMDSFASEVERLGGAEAGGGSRPAAQQPFDPLADELNRWQSKNGHSRRGSD